MMIYLLAASLSQEHPFIVCSVGSQVAFLSFPKADGVVAVFHGMRLCTNSYLFEDMLRSNLGKLVLS